MNGPLPRRGIIGWLRGLFATETAQPVEDAAAAKPKQRRPRRSKEEMAIVRAEQLERRKVTFKENATRNRERSAAAGIKRYRWSSACDERVCESCAENHGKVFDISTPTEHGYPGEVACRNSQACRCVLVPLTEGVDY